MGRLVAPTRKKKQGMNITPTPGHIVARRDEVDEMSPGGIVLPETSKKASCWGRIVAAADDIEDFHDGDRICFGEFAGQEVVLNGETLIVLRLDEVYFRVG